LTHESWCGWRGSNPRPLASEVRTADRVSETVSLDFQWFCGGTVLSLSEFYKTHRVQHARILRSLMILDPIHLGVDQFRLLIAEPLYCGRYMPNKFASPIIRDLYKSSLLQRERSFECYRH
jgi:hypothetical protein